MLERAWRDLLFGIRWHLKTPLSTAAIVVTLAIGIGATAASFSIANAFFIRPLPISEPEQVVRIYGYREGSTAQYFPVSDDDLRELRGLRPVFEDAVVEQPRPFIIGTAGSYERIWGEMVSARYFTVLGVTPVLGRVFTAQDGERGSAVAVLGHGMWMREFGGDPAVLDREVRIDGRLHRVIGIAPAAFRGTLLSFTSDVWVPGSPEPSDGFALARLRPGVQIDQVRAAVDGLARRLEREDPGRNQGARLAAFGERHGRVPPPFHDGVLGFSALLVAAALLATALACANVAGVLVARAAARRAEIGTRLALGASRARVVAQLLAESVPLSIAAGVLGTLAAWQATRAIGAIVVPLARGAQLSLDVGIDRRVLGISIAATMLTGILFGLVPAFEASRTSVLAALRSSPRGGGSPAGRLQRLLLAAQVAASMVLLAGGGFFVQSLRHAADVDLGFDPARVVTTSVDIRVRNDPPEAARRFWTQLIDDVRRLPDTESASLTARLPLELGIVELSLAPEGFQPQAGRGWPSAEFSVVDGGYFDTLRIPILDGRDFDGRDTADATPAIIVNDVVAGQFWPDGAAVGRTVVDTSGTRFEVVGVVRRSKYLSIGEEPKPYVYFPLGQGSPSAMTIVARSAGDSAAYLRDIAAAVARADPTAPSYEAGLLSARVDTALAPTSGAAATLGIVSLMALLLTSLGLFGAVAQAVSRRTYEIGVRRALGARDRNVASLVMRDTIAATAVGALGGLALALPAAHLLEALLYDVAATDPTVLGACVAVLLAVCAAAAVLPTMRAIRMDPATALRHE
jgi:predicted permease